MTDLMRYAAALAGEPCGKAPPVETWRPAHCGEIDLVIRRDGVWVHEGKPIARARLVRLFSTILRKEGDRYFLVTPAEKLGIIVEDAPFLAVLARIEGEGDGQRIRFTTNVGDEVTAGPGHALRYSASGEGRAPYLHVRAGLEALVSRAAFYDLVAAGETRDINSLSMFGVASCGVFFPFCGADELGDAELPAPERGVRR